MSRLVVVSNRVVIDEARAAPGGLAVALRSVLRERGGLWFGWNGRVARVRRARLHLQVSGALQAATLDLSRSEYDGFYRGFCNAVLWPLCHGLDRAATAPGAVAYRSYLDVNRRYAAALAPLLRGDDLVWVHDFHLIPLGRQLRRAGAMPPLGFFLHVPFPEPGPLAALPEAASLVHALLGYDLLGFQTCRDLEGFRAAAARWRGTGALADDGSIRCGSRRVRLAVMPVGVDVDAVRREASTAAAAQENLAGGATRRRLPAGTAVVIGIDRLDPAKGLSERLRAYERLLDLPGVDPGHLSLQQWITPPRGRPDDTAALRRALARLAHRVNAHPRAAGVRPLQMRYGALPHAALMAQLAQARVGVVSALKDGMNLVAKEYVAAQDPADPGVLVLSIHAGAAQELCDAIQVDPRDPQALAQAIRVALRMPLGERRRRHAAMLAALRRQDQCAWATELRERLAAVAAVPVGRHAPRIVRRAAREPAPAASLSSA